MPGWVGLQRRAVDPYAPVDSDVVSILMAALSRTGRGVCSGFTLEVDPSFPNKLRVSSGVALKDYIVIQFQNDFVLTMDDTEAAVGSNYVVLDYVYSKTDPAPFAQILVVSTVSGYASVRHVILGTLELDGDLEISSVSYAEREVISILQENPGSVSLPGEVKISVSDLAPGYLGEKIDNSSITVDSNVIVASCACDSAALAGKQADQYLGIDTSSSSYKALSDIDLNSFGLTNIGSDVCVTGGDVFSQNVCSYGNVSVGAGSFYAGGQQGCTVTVSFKKPNDTTGILTICEGIIVDVT